MYLIFKEGKFRVLDNSAKICSSRNYSETLNLRNWLNLNPVKYLKSLSLQKLVPAKISSLNIICLTKKAPYVKMWNKSKPVNSISDSSTILHCLKSFQIRSYFWSVFGHFLRIENLWRLLAFGFSFSYSLLFLLLHLSSYSDDCLRGFQETLFTPSRLSNACIAVMLISQSSISPDSSSDLSTSSIS